MSSAVFIVRFVLTLVVAVLSGSVSSKDLPETPTDADIEDALTIFSILNRPRKIQSDATFSFSDCGSSADPGHLLSMSIQPSPIALPGNVTVSFSGSLSSSLSSSISLKTKLKKKIGPFWIEVPCIEHKGSCEYDVCSLLSQMSCPSQFKQHNIPCKCPIGQGKYALPQTSFFVDIRGIPGGEYKLQATLKQSSGEIACVNADFSIA